MEDYESGAVTAEDLLSGEKLVKDLVEGCDRGVSTEEAVSIDADRDLDLLLLILFEMHQVSRHFWVLALHLLPVPVVEGE